MFSPLNRFDRLIAESEARIEEQRKLIVVFGELGMSAVEAEKRLTDFEELLEVYMEARETILAVQEMLNDSDRLTGDGKSHAKVGAREEDS